MRFERLRLRNFKCYEDADVRFSPGVTVIHGVNGSGKTTLLEACFFALYGTDALPTGHNRETVITKGAQEAAVELWLEHDDTTYQVKRELRHANDQVHHDAVLKTPSERFEGVTSVDEAVRDALRMDADAFLNCAYVRQGDVTRLLAAAPDDRQRMIDDLLQLGKLETYRERMEYARRGVDRVRRDRAAKLEDVTREIQDLEDEAPADQVDELTEQIAEIDDELAEIAEELETARVRRDDLRDGLDTIRAQADELAEARAEYDDRREQLEETRDRLEALEDETDRLSDREHALAQEVQEACKQAGVEASAATDDDATGRLDWQTIGTAADQAADTLDAEVESVTEAIQTTRERARDAAAESQRLADRADTLRDQADDSEERAVGIRESIVDKRAQLEAREAAIEEKRGLIADQKTRFDAADVPEDVGFGDAAAYRDAREDAVGDLRERDARLQAELEAVERRIEHAEALLEEGRCPECGQVVEDAPEVSRLPEDRETAADLREERESLREEITARDRELETARALVEVEDEVRRLEQELASVETLLADARDAVASLEEDAEAAEAQAERLRAEAAEAGEASAEKAGERDEILEEVASLEDRERDLVADRDRVGVVVERVREYQRVVERVADRAERVEAVRALVDEHAERVAEVEARVAALEDALEEVDVGALEEDLAGVAADLERVEGERERLRDERDALTERRGEVRGMVDRLADQRERADELAGQVGVLAGTVEECESLQELYAALRTELRKRNVRHLERFLNESFELVYENDAYARIELSDAYELTVYEKTGEPLDPDELSGGEQALFNLSLRCAIYQLLVEGMGGDSLLPPLILDEPTVHLDAEHVNRISDLVDRMRRLGVEQTIVVSHEPGIVDTADERVEVRQNPSTNRSRVNLESTDLLAGL